MPQPCITESGGDRPTKGFFMRARWPRMLWIRFALICARRPFPLAHFMSCSPSGPMGLALQPRSARFTLSGVARRSSYHVSLLMLHGLLERPRASGGNMDLCSHFGLVVHLLKSASRKGA